MIKGGAMTNSSGMFNDPQTTKLWSLFIGTDFDDRSKVKQIGRRFRGNLGKACKIMQERGDKLCVPIAVYDLRYAN